MNETQKRLMAQKLRGAIYEHDELKRKYANLKRTTDDLESELAAERARSENLRVLIRNGRIDDQREIAKLREMLDLTRKNLAHAERRAAR